MGDTYLNHDTKSYDGNLTLYYVAKELGPVRVSGLTEVFVAWAVVILGFSVLGFT